MHWIFLLFSFVIHSLHAGEILATNDFNCIEEEIEKLDGNSLVLFDVDGTLIVPDDSILKPKWKSLFNQLVAEYKDTQRDLFREIRLKAKHSLVDSRSINLIHNLHQKNIPVIAFTAAPAKINDVEPPGDWRINELKQHGFDFGNSLNYVDALELPTSPGQTHYPLFKSGVLYSSFHPKGDILIQFLEYIHLIPNKVVFVDDEFVHVQSVVSTLEKRGIDCIGIHYTTANEMPCDLKFEQANFQIKYFIEHDVWLTDKECLDMISLRF